MAGETDPRCRSKRRQWEKLKLHSVIALLFLLLLLYNQPVQPALAIHVGRMGSNPMEPAPTQAVRRPPGTRSNPRRLSSDLNYHINGPAVASRARHVRRSPPSSSSANSERYNVSAHEVAAGPNPTRNK